MLCSPSVIIISLLLVALPHNAVASTCNAMSIWSGDTCRSLPSIPNLTAASDVQLAANTFTSNCLGRISDGDWTQDCLTDTQAKLSRLDVTNLQRALNTAPGVQPLAKLFVAVSALLQIDFVNVVATQQMLAEQCSVLSVYSSLFKSLAELATIDLKASFKLAVTICTQDTDNSYCLLPLQQTVLAYPQVNDSHSPPFPFVCTIRHCTTTTTARKLCSVLSVLPAPPNVALSPISSRSHFEETYHRSHYLLLNPC